MPKLLDINKFCEELPEVKTIKLINKKKFHKDGLFSEQIFGPLKNYTCQCGTYYGISAGGTICPQCDVEITSNVKRRRQFAKIALPIPVINPIFYDLVVKLCGSDIKKALDLLLTNDKSFLFVSRTVSKDSNYIDYEVGENLVPDEKFPRPYDKFEKLQAIEEMVKIGIDLDQKKCKYLKDNIDKLFMNNIIVLPPDLRPTSISSSNFNEQAVDKINRYYTQILMKVKGIRNAIVNVSKDKKIFYYNFTKLQKNVNELYDHILSKLSKKEGLIRGNILGKRIDFSGRAVIIPDPSLKLDECTIPYTMFLELFKPKIIQKLVEIGEFKSVNKAITFIDECIKTKSLKLLKICEYLSKDEYCILNRQPSLHRLSMLAFKIRIEPKLYMLNDVIRIHPLCCHGFNADFDGDQMAVHIPISDEAKQEIKEKFLITENLYSPSDASIAQIPSQDIILGIYILTAGKLPGYNETDKEYKGKKIHRGLISFNQQLPEDYKVIDYIVGKKELVEILNDIASKYPKEIVREVLDSIKSIGVKLATYFGPTLSLDLCEIPGAKEMKNWLYEPSDLNEQMERSNKDDIKDYLKSNFYYGYYVESGARGNWDQIKQITLTRGFVSNSIGEIIPTPIKHSLIEGLNEREFFNSTYGSRKGLLDVALNTGSAGYLTRKLIFTCINQELDTNVNDCGTKDTVELFVSNEHKARMLLFRNYVERGKIKNINKDNYQNIIGKKIKLRSPIFCKSPNICKTCYGNLYDLLQSKYIGVIAAQVLGEVGTQLTLRTFHLSGSANLQKGEDGKVNMKQSDIISDLKVVINLLHSFEGKTYSDILNDLFEVYNSNKPIHYIHFECVVSQLMWKGNEKWRLQEKRNINDVNYYSIQTVPKYESWLLAIAFSNPKQSLLEGLVNERRYSGIIDKILLGEKVT